MTITHTPDGVAIRFVFDGRELDHFCRACHRTGRSTVYARVAAAQHPEGWAEWVVCTHCGSAGAVGLEPPAYETELPASPAALKYYVEQGAAIDVLAGLIAGVKRDGPTKILDVGCSFGFLLDYARGALGWEPQGIDPSTFAIAGRKVLDLPIAGEYLMPDNAQQYSADVIVCSEIIEHLTDPDPFLNTLKLALRPGGTIVLTTPSASGVRQGLGTDRNILAHGPGQHIVCYSERGLEAALRRAGFTEVEVIETDGHVHLLGGASMREGAVDLSRKLDRAQFRAWLSRRAEQVSDPALEAGFRGRLLKLCVAAGAWDEAREAAAKLHTFFAGLGIDLAKPEAYQPSTDPDFAGFGMSAPCCTGSVLFNLGRLAEQDDELLRAEAHFRAMVRYGEALNSRLYQLAALDLETSEQILAAQASAAVLRVARDPAGGAEELRAIGAAAFEPGRCSPYTFFRAASAAHEAGLDIGPLEGAGTFAATAAREDAGARFWIMMAIAALALDDTERAARMLGRVAANAAGEAGADHARLLVEVEFRRSQARKRALLDTVAGGRLAEAAMARECLSASDRDDPDLRIALGLLALHHDCDIERAVALLAGDPAGEAFLQTAFRAALTDAVAEGRLADAADLRGRLAQQALDHPDVRVALGLLALNHDRDPAAAIAILEQAAEGGGPLQMALRQAFMTAVGTGRLGEAGPLRARLSETSLAEPDLQLALGLYALNAEGDAAAAAGFFENSPEPSAAELRRLAIRRAFIDHCLRGEFSDAARHARAVESELDASPESREPEHGRAAVALAIYAKLKDDDVLKARRYARRARAFDLEPELRTVLKGLRVG